VIFRRGADGHCASTTRRLACVVAVRQIRGEKKSWRDAKSSRNRPAASAANPHGRLLSMNVHANNAGPTSLETDIVNLYSQYYALTHELLTKIRLFDESNEWAQQNFQSCAHWLHFRVGLSLHAAQEKVCERNVLQQRRHMRE
jgi:hypothetical protein